MKHFFIYAWMLLFASCNNKPTSTVAITGKTVMLPEQLHNSAGKNWKVTATSFDESSKGKLNAVIFNEDGTCIMTYRLSETSSIAVAGKVNFIQNKSRKKQFHFTAGTDANKYSGNWLWEKISFPQLPTEDFLLLVDLSLHPEAAYTPAINHQFVSKLHL